MTNAVTTRPAGATQVLRPQTFEQLSQFAAMARTAPPATDATDDGWPGPGGDA
jgi:hypothetical protein